MGHLQPLLATNTVRDQLRAHCMPIHQRVEDVVEAIGYFSNPDLYPQWLKIMHQMHRTFADDYDDGARRLGLPSMSEPLLDALERDLGTETRTKTSIARPLYSAQDGIGIAYVFEGSAMGGKLLQRRMAGMPGVSTRYIDTLVSASRVRWPQVKTALGDIQDDPAPILASALFFFDTLLSTFQEDL